MDEEQHPLVVARLTKGWTQTELAVYSQTAVKTISDTELCKLLPRFPTVAAWAYRLGLDADKLYADLKRAYDKRVSSGG